MSVALGQPLEQHQKEAPHRDPLSMPLLQECNKSTVPCTPPLSPNLDLSSSTNAIHDPVSTDLADPSTPPPSRSSTVKKTTTHLPVTSHITSIDNNDHPVPPADHNKQIPSKDHTFIKDLNDPLSRQPSISTSSSSDQVILQQVSAIEKVEEHHEEYENLTQYTTVQRNVSRPQIRLGYVDTDDEDDDSKQLSIGTRIAKGHRHYTLM